MKLLDIVFSSFFLFNLMLSQNINAAQAKIIGNINNYFRHYFEKNTPKQPLPQKNKIWQSKIGNFNIGLSNNSSSFYKNNFHSSKPQTKMVFHHFSKQQWINYFSNAYKSPFENFDFYKFQSFRGYLQALPDFDTEIVKLDNKQKNNPFFARQCKAIKVNRSVGFPTVSEYLSYYGKSSKENLDWKKKQQEIKNSQKKYIQKQKNLQKLIQKIFIKQKNTLEYYQKKIDPKHKKADFLLPKEKRQKRFDAIAKAIENSFRIIYKRYNLSSQSIKLLKQHNIKINQFQECTGNEIQQQIHQEFVDVLNNGSQFHSKQGGIPSATNCINENWFSTLSKVSFVGSSVNNAGFYSLAHSISNICEGIYKIGKNSTKSSFNNLETDFENVESIWNSAVICVGNAMKNGGDYVCNFTDGVQQKAVARPTRFLTEFVCALQNNPDIVFTKASNLLLESIHYAFDSTKLINNLVNNPLSQETFELVADFEQNWAEPLYKKVSTAAQIFWKMPTQEKIQEVVALGVQVLAIVGATKLVAALPAQMMLIKTSALLQLDKLSKISGPIIQHGISSGGQTTIAIQTVDCMSEELVAAAERAITVAAGVNVGIATPVTVDAISTAVLAMKNNKFGIYQRKTKIGREKATKIRKRIIRIPEEIIQECKRLAGKEIEWQGTYDLSEVENILLPKKIVFTEKSLAHVFSGKVEKLSGNGPLKISGFHSDYKGKAFRQSGMNMKKIRDSKTGVFEAKIRFCGKTRDKTMFPSNLKPNEILNLTKNAMQNIFEIIPEKYGRLRFRGLADSGMIIQVVTEAKGEVVTFYPLFERS